MYGIDVKKDYLLGIGKDIQDTSLLNCTTGEKNIRTI